MSSHTMFVVYSPVFSVCCFLWQPLTSPWAQCVWHLSQVRQQVPAALMAATANMHPCSLTSTFDKRSLAT